MNHKYHNIILSIHFSHVCWPAFVIPPWGWPLTPWRVKWPVWRKSPSLISKQARDWWVSTTFAQDLLVLFCLLLNNCVLFAYFLKGMYIKSTYDGLHVITGTTENVRQQNNRSLWLVFHFLLLMHQCQASFKPQSVTNGVHKHCFNWFMTSICVSPFSLQQTELRGFMQAMKWFKSTDKQWWVHSSITWLWGDYG